MIERDERMIIYFVVAALVILVLLLVCLAKKTPAHFGSLQSTDFFTMFRKSSGPVKDLPPSYDTLESSIEQPTCKRGQPVPTITFRK